MSKRDHQNIRSSDGQSLVHDDPHLSRDRKEASWIMLSWLACMLWSLGFSYGFGSSSEIGFTLGIPNWVWLGVILPWLMATSFSIYFALGIMGD